MKQLQSKEVPYRTIVVLSGGMDSATALAYTVNLWGKENVIALTFDYGQRHAKEIEATRNLAEHFGVRQIICKVDLRQVGGSSLTDSSIAVPEQKVDEDPWKHVALTYVPMRNTIFLALAAAYAEVLNCTYIYTGFNYIDSGGYPDTRPEYVDAMNKVMSVGSRDKPTIVAPYVRATKKDIVLDGVKYHVPWEKTWSCYEGGETPCGKCNACVQRKKGFDAAGVVDPLIGGEAPAVQVQERQTSPQQTLLPEKESETH